MTHQWHPKIAAAGLALALMACTSSDNPSDPGPTTGTIAGLVTDALTGQPLAGATVVTSPATATVTTNAQGAYSIPNVPTGSYSVTASHAGYNANSTTAVAVASLTVTVNLALTPQGGSIAGIVTDASNGQPIAGASVTTQPPTSSVTTNAQGGYSIPGIPGGTYTVTATRSGYASNSATVGVTVGGTATANLALVPLPGTLSGVVTDASTGAPIANATVTTQPPTVGASTNAQGAYTIPNVAAGNYTVMVSRTGYTPGQTNATVGPGQNATANVALAPIPGAIAGVVTNATNGTPLAGASVSTQPPTTTVTTNAQGQYSIANVPPGTYTVNVSLAGYSSNSGAATVASSLTTTTNVALTPLPGSITGLITDASTGQPIAGASVSTAPATSTVTTNAQGQYTIPNVPAGNYTVTATRTGYSPASGPVTVPPGQAATRNLAMSTQPAYDGTWTGTTSDGKTIGFTIANNAFTLFSLTYNAAACGTSGGVNITYNTPQPISGSSFTISSAGSPPVRIAFTVQGTFSSGTNASGTINFTVTLSFPVGNCSTSYNVTWTASR